MGQTRFVVIGAGGLGCPALLGLVMGGAHRLTILDHDVVEAHNLQRQVLFSLADVGARKVDAAARNLHGRGHALDLTPVHRNLHARDVDAFVAEITRDDAESADAARQTVLLECTDSPALKFAFSDAALRHRVPLVVAAALGWRGQAIAIDGRHACYRCIYEAPPPLAAVPTCAEAGVLGAGVGMLGILAAGLALRLAAGEHDACGSLHVVDLLGGTARQLSPRIRAGCTAPHHDAAASSQ